MGGHVAEKLFIGGKKVSSGCGSDMQNATRVATTAARKCGMFSDLVGYNSTNFDDTSEEYNAQVDKAVKQILDVSETIHFDLTQCLMMSILQESHKRVEQLLLSKDKELRRLASYLYEHDILDADEMDKIIKGKGLDKDKEESKVRELDTKLIEGPKISYA